MIRYTIDQSKVDTEGRLAWMDRKYLPKYHKQASIPGKVESRAGLDTPPESYLYAGEQNRAILKAAGLHRVGLHPFSHLVGDAR
jgi:hypothetical protein